MNEDGEPIGRGRLDRRAGDAWALQDAAFAIAAFTGVVVVNGLLAILLIELFQLIGWWEAPISEEASASANDVARRLRVGVALAA